MIVHTGAVFWSFIIICFRILRLLKYWFNEVWLNYCYKLLMTFQVLVLINEKVMTLFYKEMVIVLLNKKFKFIVIFGTLHTLYFIDKH